MEVDWEGRKEDFVNQKKLHFCYCFPLKVFYWPRGRKPVEKEIMQYQTQAPKEQNKIQNSDRSLVMKGTKVWISVSGLRN